MEKEAIDKALQYLGAVAAESKQAPEEIAERAVVPYMMAGESMSFGQASSTLQTLRNNVQAQP